MRVYDRYNLHADHLRAPVRALQEPMMQVMAMQAAVAHDVWPVTFLRLERALLGLPLWREARR